MTEPQVQRKRGEHRIGTLRRQLRATRQQLAACHELIKLFSAELNRRVMGGHQGDESWGVVWRRVNSTFDDSEWFPADHGHGAATLYEVLAKDPSVSAVALQKVITIKHREN
ncbi:hypothetical protein [Arthrobacter sp. L77]|uniref:hypothetical protein n=1 Tax=Arthrobacter sp. L77 TaxID=1496689 RepID=UPI0005BE4719|nr:hypothetical protein [Arthrobacter sp. L77]